MITLFTSLEEDPRWAGFAPMNPHCMTSVKKNVYKKDLSPMFTKVVNNTTSNIIGHKNRF